MQSVVVTGVSTGIGWSIANILTKHGIRVFGSVRKNEDAGRLSTEFGENFIPLLFDVTDAAAVQTAAQQVREHLNGEKLFGLVNNAGVAVPGLLMYLPIDDFRRQIEVNVVSVLIVTRAFLPLLGSDRSLRGKPGRIINMSSVSGKRGAPFVGSYVASKHALEGLSESLRRELMLYGIDVIVVGPGAVATPIWGKAEAAEVSIYKDTEYARAAVEIQRYMIERGKRGLPPERVGQVVLHALTTSRPRVRYAVVPNALINWFISTLLPKRFADWIIARRLGFR